MNLKAIVERRAKCALAVEQMAEETRGRNLSSEELTKWDKLESEWKAADAEVRRATALEDIKASEAAQRAADNPQDTDTEKRYNDAFSAYLRRGSVALNDEQRALLENRAAISGVTGTALIPEQMAKTIEIAIRSYGGMFSAGEIITSTTGGKLNMPTINDTASKAIIVEEYDESLEETKQFGSTNIDVFTYRTPIVPISLELLQDSAFDMPAIVSQLLAEAFGRGANEHLTTGDGKTKPSGIITDAHQIGVASQTAITFDNLISLMEGLDSNYAQKAKFMMNLQTMFALARLKDKNDRFIWSEAVTKGVDPMLFGKGLAINDDMQGIGAGNSSVIYGDLSKYKIRMVKGFNVLRLNELLLKNLSIGMFGFARVGGKLLDAGTHPVLKLTHAGE